MNKTRWTIKWDPTADTRAKEMSGAYSQVFPLGKDRGALVLRYSQSSSEEAWTYYEVVLERVGVGGSEEMVSLAECASITDAMEAGIEWALAMGWIGRVGPRDWPEWEILDIPDYLPQDVFSDAGKWTVQDIVGKTAI